jgi:hypothetical protein
MWVQGLPPEKMTWDEAVAGAPACEVGGYDDWRLPTIRELYSLILFSGTDPSGPVQSDPVPFIDTDYFEFEYGDTLSGERLIDAQYWSSTEYQGLTMAGDSTAFGVNFADGRIKGYPSEPVGPPGQQVEMSSFVRYVRGDGYGENQFSDNGDGTVTDLGTGLMWQQADDGTARNWEDALEYAEDLTLAGYADWRLPDVHELQSIVDYTRSLQSTGSPAIDPVFFCTEIADEAGEPNFGFYWTGTTHASTSASEPGTYAAYIAFGEALGWMQDPQSQEWELWDVHGAGAQRSDPKCGDPEQYPHGHGPQGDVIRIYNLVRCVRDTGTGVETGETAGSGTIRGVYPNPFRDTATVLWSTGITGPAKLEVFDASGRLVAVLEEGTVEAGAHTTAVDLSECSAGAYFCRLTTAEGCFSESMVALE